MDLCSISRPLAAAPAWSAAARVEAPVLSFGQPIKNLNSLTLPSYHLTSRALTIDVRSSGHAVITTQLCPCQIATVPVNLGIHVARKGYSNWHRLRMMLHRCDCWEWKVGKPKGHAETELVSSCHRHLLAACHQGKVVLHNDTWGDRTWDTHAC